jgi:hypothetical protein
MSPALSHVFGKLDDHDNERERASESTNAHKGNGKLEEREEIDAHRSAQVTNTCTTKQKGV